MKFVPKGLTTEQKQLRLENFEDTLDFLNTVSDLLNIIIIVGLYGYGVFTFETVNIAKVKYKTVRFNVKMMLNAFFKLLRGVR